MLNTLESEDLSTTASTTPRPSGNRRVLVLLAAGGIGVSMLLFVLSAVMGDNARFSEDYLARQLSEQKITFKSADTLTPAERETPCLVKFAGQPLTTGKQAECYANSFIGVHLKSVADGKTFSEMRGVQTTLRAQLAEAQAKGDPSAADLQKQLSDVTAKRQTLFEGESMRGLLLTSYGFDTLGQKANDASTIALNAGIGLFAVSLLGLVWAVTRKPAASVAA